MKKTIIVLMAISFMLVFSPYVVENVRCANITVENWDSYSIIGQDNGSTSLFSWSRYQGNDFDIINEYLTSSPYCLQAFEFKQGDDLSVDAGYMNFTGNYSYIEEISFDYDIIHTALGSGNSYLDWTFTDVNGTEILVIRWATVSASEYFQVKNHEGNFENVVVNQNQTGSFTFVISHLSGNMMNYSLYDRSSGHFVSGIDTTCRLTSNYMTFYSIKGTWDNTFDCQELNIKLDDIKIKTSILPPDEDSGLYDFSINFYDQETQTSLVSISPSFVGPIQSGIDYHRGYINSDLWGHDYLNGGSDTNPVEITTEYATGSWHWINVTYPYGVVDGEEVSWKNYSLFTQIYPGNTFNIFLQRYEESDDAGWNNCGNMGFSPCEFSTWTQVCTDKQIYSFGEQILIRSLIPPYQELHDCWAFDGDAYQLWIYNNEDIPLFWFDHGESATKIFPETGFFDMGQHGSYQYFQWNAPEPTGGNDFYTIYIAHSGGGIFGQDYTLAQVGFTVANGSFSPEGEITGVNPNPAFLGQNVNISFTANNNGKLTKRNILKPGDTEQTLTTFNRFTGTEYVNTEFFEFGAYQLKLYVHDGYTYEQVDTEIVYVNTTNETIGAFGYGVEYLQVTPYRAIGGFDNMEITYNTLNDTTPFIIYDARGQRTAHSLLVNKGSGSIRFDLPQRSAIGEWQIFMYGNETLNTSFFVVADENNWVEFAKNSFFNDEPFSIKLKHDRKVEIEFLKNDIAVGQNWFLQANENGYGYFEVPFQIITPSPGEWTVNLYEVNNLVRRELLATDTCIVTEQPTPTGGDSGNVYDSILTMISSTSDFFGGGAFGLGVISGIIILVLTYILADSKVKQDVIFLIDIIAILLLVYIGWLPFWIAIVGIIIAGFSFGGFASKKLGIGKG